MSFLEYLELLQRRWRIWVSMILVGVLAAVALSVLAEKQYTAVSTSFVTVSDSDAAASGEIFQGSQFIVQRMASYAALSSSREILEPVIEELDLDVSARELRDMIGVSSPTDSILLQVSVEDTEPHRAATIADAISLRLGTMIEELETPRGLAASTVKVTLYQPADDPISPSSPRLTLNLLLGLVGGAAVGLLLALLREHLDRRVKTVDDILSVTGITPLGSTIASRRAEADPLVAMSFRSVEAENYRTIKAALKLANADRGWRNFVVSSPMPGDGKSTVAANLAISWALAGSRVCLVDAGMRQSTASQVLGLDSTAGLSDVLLGESELDAVLTSWNDGIVTVLPSGSMPLDPAELLGSKAMGKLIAELRSRFDVVIYDAGPLLSVADTTVLAQSLDGLLLVVRAGRTTREQLAACMQIVEEARITLLGTVRAGVKVHGRAAHQPGTRVAQPVHRAVPDRQEAEVARQA